MISLADLADLAAEHREDLRLRVAPVRLGDRVLDADRRPVVMGSVNLSQDSSYRDSIAPTAESAVRKSRVLVAHGADVVDLGAESSTARAARADGDAQIAALVPVVKELAASGVAVSVETYLPDVVRAGLEAGAVMVNYTGSEHDDAVFRLVGEHGASLVLCSSPSAHVREIVDVDLDDPFPGLVSHFERRIDAARGVGVESIVLDPGMGFYYGNLVDPLVRVAHQMHVIMRSARLRRLGYPVCQALPHTHFLFEDQFRTAEGFYTVFALLAGTHLLRVHEVAHVTAVMRAMAALQV